MFCGDTNFFFLNKIQTFFTENCNVDELFKNVNDLNRNSNEEFWSYLNFM